MFYFLINVCTFKIVMMMCDNVLRGTYLVNMLIISVKSFFCSLFLTRFKHPKIMNAPIVRNAREGYSLNLWAGVYRWAIDTHTLY